MKHFFFSIATGILCFGFLIPVCCHAASLRIVASSQDVRVGDVFFADVILTQDNSPINSGEISLTFDTTHLYVQGVSTGNSLFTLWLRTPVFSNATGKIFFVGGTPNGIEKDGRLARIIFLATRQGIADIAFENGKGQYLYANDGKGTVIPPKLQPLSFSIGSQRADRIRDDWSVIVEADVTPPHDIQITLGKDEVIFSGKYFISFSARDEESGIKSYEVRQGKRGKFTSSESPVVLQNQFFPVPI